MTEWRKIKRFDGYEISSDGKVRSNRHKSVNKILRVSCATDHYPRVVLCINNKRKNMTVHRLVANAFIKNPNAYKVVNHKNGIKTDNRAENLEWCTHGHNTRHAMNEGLINIMCENAPSAKLTNENVLKIKKMLIGKELTHKDISKIFGVHETTISSINTGKNWSTLKLKELER